MSDRPCNRCELDHLIAQAGLQAQPIEVIDRPSKHFPEGKEVLIGGEFVAWFAKVPDRCEC